MTYIDGFVAAIPKANKARYQQHAREGAELFKKWGATRVVENWGDDVPEGTLTDFYRAVQARDDEVILFSWIEYPDKATRDAVQKKMIEDPQMGQMELPFDGKRMIFGGFETLFAI
ncbi:MAG: RNA signal recognition particle [Pelagibacterium sp. SCN 63-23]|nr:MAG: RNA signal recognition particle [Pelagibacterium sp. SCN 63-23]